MASEKSIHEFIAAHGLTAEIKAAHANPHMDDMAPDSKHYSVKISQVGFGPVRSMVVPYSMGPAHKRGPTLAGVLDCLASDASTLENARDFEDWCSDFGYDTDSRKAEATWRAIMEQSTQLRKLLGYAAYSELLNEVERE